MGKYKKLLSNTLIFTVSEFSSKLLVFFMVPVYTRVMTTYDFGASDLINSTVGLLMPVLTLRIADGVLRFAMSRDVDNRQVFSFGLKVILVGCGILLLFLPVWMNIGVIKDYLLLFYLIYITSSLHNYFNQFARAINKIKLVGICGIVGTVVVVISNIVLLIVFRLGVEGYLISFILSNFICSVILFIGGGMYKFLTTMNCEKPLRKEMLLYSIPFVPNSLSWWLNDAANRYIITTFCGVSEVGLFAVATRIPAILVTFQGVFYQAWQLSAISEYEKKDTVEFFSKMYRIYNLVMLLGCSVLITIIKVLAIILFSGEFYTAWRYIPFLLISVVFGALSGFLGSFYSASKQTQMLFVTTLAGGIVSVGINFLLVPYWGPMGASVTSVVAYALVWLIRLIDSRKYVKLQISIKTDCFCYVLIISQALMMVFLPGIVGYLSSGVVFVVILLLNIKDLKDLHRMAEGFIKVKRGTL